MKTLSIILAVILIVGCKDKGTKPTPTPEPTPVPTLEPRNPDCESGVSFGSDSNVWKPKSERLETLVLLLDKKFTVPFTCAAQRKDGRIEKLNFTGFANGDRQHHRGSRPGRDYTGKVYCGDSKQSCLFSHPTGKTGQRAG